MKKWNIVYLLSGALVALICHVIFKIIGFDHIWWELIIIVGACLAIGLIVDIFRKSLKNRTNPIEP